MWALCFSTVLGAEQFSRGSHEGWKLFKSLYGIAEGVSVTKYKRVVYNYNELAVIPIISDESDHLHQHCKIQEAEELERGTWTVV